jgi:hypothetical protein
MCHPNRLYVCLSLLLLYMDFPFVLSLSLYIRGLDFVWHNGCSSLRESCISSNENINFQEISF